MSAIITDYDIVMKDGSNPSTSTASGNLNADRYSEIMPVTRAFMGDIQLHWVAGPVGVMKVQVSNDPGALRAVAKRDKLIKGDEKLSGSDLSKLAKKAKEKGNKLLAKRVALAKTFAKMRKK